MKKIFFLTVLIFFISIQLKAYEEVFTLFRTADAEITNNTEKVEFELDIVCSEKIGVILDVYDSSDQLVCSYNAGSFKDGGRNFFGIVVMNLETDFCQASIHVNLDLWNFIHPNS